MPRSLANALMLLAGLVWGGGFVAQETAMDDIGPFLFIATRFALACLAVLPLVIYELRRSDATLSRADWVSMLVVGAAFFTAMALQQVGLLATTVTNAGVFTGLYVVLVPIIALVALQMKQSWIVWPCAFVAFAGIWLLGGGGIDGFNWGDWLVLLGAVFAALHVLAIDWSVRRHHRPMALAAVQFAACGLGGLAGFTISRLLDWQYEAAFALPTLLNAAPEIAYAAFFAGALAFTIMTVCQQYTAPATAAILLSSESLFAALGGALLLGERLPFLGYIGCGLLFASIAIVSAASARQELRESPA